VTAPRSWFAAALFLATALAGSAADTDPYGDPLPAGAKARLGTARLRAGGYATPVLSADGKTVFAQTNTGLQRFDPATGAARGKVQKTFGGSVAAVSADGTRVALLGYGDVTVWDVGAGKVLVKVQRRLPTSSHAAAMSADGKVLVLGAANDFGKADPIAVAVWDVSAGKEVQQIKVPYNQWANVAVSGDGKTVATWGGHSDPNAKGLPDPETDLNRFVHFWDAATGKPLAKFRTSGDGRGVAAFGPDGATAAVSNNNGSIDLVDPKTGASKHLLLGRSRMGQWLAFSPDGATLAAASDDGAVQRWSVADGVRLSTTEPPVQGTFGARVLLADKDRGVAWTRKGLALVVWEVPSGKLVSPEGGHTTAVRGIAFTPDGKFVVTSADEPGGREATALKWELATGKPAGTVTLHQPGGALGGFGPAALFSADVSRALVRDGSGTFGVYDAATGGQQFVLPVAEGYGSQGAFSGDGTRAVVTTSGGDLKRALTRVTVWDVAAGRRVLALDLPGVATATAALTPDNKSLVTASRKPAETGIGTFVVTAWDAATGAKKGEHTEEGGYALAFVAPAPDGKTAAVVTARGQLVAFDLTTGKVGKTYDAVKGGAVVAPVFSPDGKSLAVAGQVGFGADPTSPVRVIDWATGETKHTFASKGGSIAALAFSPDGKWLVSGCDDTTATVWDLSK
jgi:WD40 repeat protein